MTESKRNKRIGRPPKHGGFSIVYKDEHLKRHPKLREYLQDARAGLVRDIAGSEDNLTEQQRIMINMIISKLSIVRLIECYVEANGAFNGDSLKGCLGQSYLAFSNSIDRALVNLGLDRKAADDAIDPLKYIQGEDRDDDQGEKGKS
jgi:hypothetical protein